MAHPGALEVLAGRLADLDQAGLKRRLVSMGPATGARVVIDGRPVILLASNDYLGLARHPRLAAAALRAAQEQGSGSGASRLISGTLDSHLALEAEIAAFKKAPAALYFSSGYLANLGAVTGLTQAGDLIVSDRLNHASLIDACRLSRARRAIYPHGDWRSAGEILAQAPETGLKLIVTDGVFSMDGDLAPLPELLDLARRHDALLVVDDAHATGVWGAEGRGSFEHYGLTPGPQAVMVGTFSKALGGLGGFVAGAREVVDTLVSRARSFLYTTSPPPAQVAVARESLALVREMPELRQKLFALSDLLRRKLEEGGLTVTSPAGPIVPVLVGDTGRALALAAALLDEGVFAPAIRPPTVPPGSSRVRLAVSAAHSEEDVEQAAAAVLRAARKVGG
ncbi:MAG: 8-amino-7-oxononanoate synthase [Deltaproteobacteria bacterium]|nr:8-amino-7-oxononanoate synthase [Deltaproteobacteria bacterium]